MFSRENEIEGKTNDGKSSKTPSSSTSRQWSAFKDPRIVRVSRHFRGKDRHSKVCTIRGLRDRRIRLSVPTAHQIYDLQFKLGLSQPSKVIDWLIDASKDDIDMLPPLPTIPQGFTQFHRQMHVNAALLGHVSQSSLLPFFDVNDGTNSTTPSLLPNNESQVEIDNNVRDQYDHDAMMSRSSKYWNILDSSKEQEKDVKGKRINQVGCSSFSGQVSSAQNFFPTMSHSSWPALLDNGTSMSHNSQSQWEPSNLTLSSFNNTSDTLRYQSSLGVSSSAFQPFICPPSAPQPLINPMESNTRPLDHFQFLNSSSRNLPFSLNVNHMPSQYNSESHSVKNYTNDS